MTRCNFEKCQNLFNQSITADHVQTSKSVGVIAYNLPITLNPVQKEERETFLDANKSGPPLKGANTAFEAALFGQQAEYKAKYCNPEKDICASL